MRCKNCGWPNKPGATNCSKCNAPLGETPVQAPAPEAPKDVNATVLNEPVVEAPRPETPAPEIKPVSGGRSLGGAPLGGTVFEGEAFPEATRAQAAPVAPAPAAPAESPAKPAQEAQPTLCPKCGYPLRPDTDKCPNCRFQVKAPAKVETAPAAPETAAASVTPAVPEKPAAPEKPAVPETPVAAAPVAEAPKLAPAAEPAFKRQATVGVQDAFQKPSAAFSGTVNPLVQRIVPEFKLTLQPREGERLSNTNLDFEGESVSLNRNNLEPGNNSITSREQARITCEDGKWYIEDKSQFQTTFVRAGRKTEIKDGDIILMGSRLFVFNADSAD